MKRDSVQATALARTSVVLAYGMPSWRTRPDWLGGLKWLFAILVYGHFLQPNWSAPEASAQQVQTVDDREMD